MKCVVLMYYFSTEHVFRKVMMMRKEEEKEGKNVIVHAYIFVYISKS
jgi:hypothetical protein